MQKIAKEGMASIFDGYATTVSVNSCSHSNRDQKQNNRSSRTFWKIRVLFNVLLLLFLSCTIQDRLLKMV